MRPINEFRIFIASPSGQDDIRQAFRRELQDYNETDALERGILLRPVGWEATLLGPERPQALINEDIKTCDAFVLVLQDRWGSPPATDDGPYTSGCHEEFELAKELLEDPEQDMRDLIILFRAVDLRQMADPGPQLNRVLDFRKELEQSKAHLFGVFGTETDFCSLLRKHLAAWVRKVEGRGDDERWTNDDEVGGAAIDQTIYTPGPTAGEAVKVVVAASKEVRSKEAREKNLALSISAAKLRAAEGNVTKAEQAFAKALQQGEDPEVLYEYGSFLIDQGRFDEGMNMLARLDEEQYSHYSKLRYLSLTKRGLRHLKLAADGIPKLPLRHAVAIGGMDLGLIGLRVAQGYLNPGRPIGIKANLDASGRLFESAWELEPTNELEIGSLFSEEQLARIFEIREWLSSAPTEQVKMANWYSVGNELAKNTLAIEFPFS